MKPGNVARHQSVAGDAGKMSPKRSHDLSSGDLTIPVFPRGEPKKKHHRAEECSEVGAFVVSAVECRLGEKLLAHEREDEEEEKQHGTDVHDLRQGQDEGVEEALHRAKAAQKAEDSAGTECSKRLRHAPCADDGKLSERETQYQPDDDDEVESKGKPLSLSKVALERPATREAHRFHPSSQ
eukprot:scaffold4678_cov242-Pinguiococcus_pyrenoidosus.AAC.7